MQYSNIRWEMSAVGHPRHFRSLPTMSALTPITATPVARHNGRKVHRKANWQRV